MRRHATFSDPTRIGSRGMQKGAPGAARAFHHFLCENLKIVGIVVVLFADHFHDTRPAAPQADHLVALLQRAASYSANCRVQPGNVPSPSKNSDHALFGVDVSHSRFASWESREVSFSWQLSNGPCSFRKHLLVPASGCPLR